MENKESNQQTKKITYPWKSFLTFLALYGIGLAAYYPVLLSQAELYIEIVGETSAYTPTQFALLALIQPILLGVVAIYGGHRYANKVQLRSLITEKIEKRDLAHFDREVYSLKDSVPFIVVIALGLALLNLGFDVVFQNWLPEMYQPNFVIPNISQALSNVFYSGLGQEMLLRWGVMTTIVYVFSSRGQETNQWIYLVGFVFTAILYGFAQFSSVSNYIDVTLIILVRLLLLNVLDGILYGWLYYKFHFEAAVLTHMLTNTLIILGTIGVVGLVG
jgi:hypothetical protein